MKYNFVGKSENLRDLKSCNHYIAVRSLTWLFTEICMFTYAAMSYALAGGFVKKFIQIPLKLNVSTIGEQRPQNTRID